MRPRFAVLAIVSAALLAGCRSDPYMDAYYDTVNAEKVALEDTIAELRHANRKLKEQLEVTTSGTSTSPGTSEIGPIVTPPETEEGPTITPPGVEPPANPDLSDPKTKPGREVDPREAFPNRTSMAGPELPGVDDPSSILPPAIEQPISDTGITHLHINRIATRGRNTDGRYGDDVLLIGLEPRNRYGRFVPAANPISVVVLDPQVQGSAARIAEWHFNADQVAVGSRHAGDSPVILLEASWPKRPPEHSRLQLWARYTTSDGRILQTHETIQVSVDGQYSTRWTPRQRDSAARVARQPDDASRPEWKPER